MQGGIPPRVRDLSQVDGYSLDARDRMCVDYYKPKDVVPVRICGEEGHSARYEANRERPVLEPVLGDVVKTKSFWR